MPKTSAHQSCGYSAQSLPFIPCTVLTQAADTGIRFARHAGCWRCCWRRRGRVPPRRRRSQESCCKPATRCADSTELPESTDSADSADSAHLPRGPLSISTAPPRVSRPPLFRPPPHRCTRAHTHAHAHAHAHQAQAHSHVPILDMHAGPRRAARRFSGGQLRAAPRTAAAATAAATCAGPTACRRRGESTYLLTYLLSSYLLTYLPTYSLARSLTCSATTLGACAARARGVL